MQGKAAKRAVVGILAHVDAGKTTLNEALIYRAGAVRKLGSVDAKSSHLDYNALEQQRGITIYSKQTVITRCGVELTLLDTPGHVDFAAEAERVLGVLDYAVLVIDGNDGVQGHTLTLWRLLERYGVPTVVFANKMDFAQVSRGELLADLQRQLSAGCVDFTSLQVRAPEAGADRDRQARQPDAPGGVLSAELSLEAVEACATVDEAALEEYLESGDLQLETVRRLVGCREVFPCFFGSALKQEGVDELIDGVAALVADRDWPAEFGARVFKIAHDPAGTRLTWLKVTGGSLKPRQVVQGADSKGPWSEKADQIRMYAGQKFEPAACVEAGQVCAVTGLTRTQAGMALGAEAADPAAAAGAGAAGAGAGAAGAAGPAAPGAAAQPALAPVFASSVHPIGADITKLHAALRTLTDEDPLLNVRWSEQLQELQVQLMGTIQLEVLQATLRDRFGLNVEFGPSGVLYRETIAAPVVGIGHFEPLRHYAEVHLLIEPLPAGSGVQFGTRCHVDELDLNWQRLILTNAMEREHAGVLTGAPITDVRITLMGGRAHDKHTEGGDFRQATYRAIRQGLMQAESVLLEPWHRFWLRLPAGEVGRALADLQRMGARMEPPQTEGDFALVEGAAPAKEIAGYSLQLASYSHGKGSLSLQFGGYEPCHDAEEVIAAAAYDPEADMPNTPDSVFCSHGAGHTVKWGDVREHAHVKPDPATLTEWREATPEFFGAIG